MVVEMGAKFGIIPADKKTIKWLKQWTDKPVKPVFADKDACYKDVVYFDAAKIPPTISKPHAVDNTVDISKLKGAPVNEVFIGTCTNGRLEDLKIASAILRGKKVHPEVRLIVAPASKDVFLRAMKTGIIKSLVEAGANVVTPGCGPCVGTHNGVPSDNEIVVSTANRNFKGRMGNPNAFIYLASPAVAAITALKGAITDPRKYI